MSLCSKCSFSILAFLYKEEDWIERVQLTSKLHKIITHRNLSIKEHCSEKKERE